MFLLIFGEQLSDYFKQVLFWRYHFSFSTDLGVSVSMPLSKSEARRMVVWHL